MQRRDFVKSSTLLGAAAALPRFSYAQVKGSDVIKVGLVGCGGRGTGAVCKMIEADHNMKTSFDDQERILEVLLLQLAREARNG